MAKTAHEIVESARFKALVSKRWNVSIILTVLLFIIYYGYILIVAYGKDFLAQKVGEFVNWGIILGVLGIVLSWLLTVIYIIWANNVYDKEVDALKKELL
jgi:uncharacterized membrane protein (DUF485 family)